MTKIIKHLTKKPIFNPRFIFSGLAWAGLFILTLLISAITFFVIFEKRYQDTIYPNVTIGDIQFGGRTVPDVKNYWLSRNIPFQTISFEFHANNLVATVSGTDIGLGYDATLSATQAYSIGRSGRILSDLKTKFWTKKVEISPTFTYTTDPVDKVLSDFSDSLNIAPQDALFTFNDSKVTAFKPSAAGRKVNISTAKQKFIELASAIPQTQNLKLVINVPVETVEPTITTDKANAFGIKERIGTGYSEFSGSIAGRIHNVALAATRFNGVLIPPGETMSFNKTLGDVSAATGYQQAYIIKEGRTVLGDGGGVCQVSTTLFRAAMDAGLPIIERHAHAYRVHYYEEGGFKAGLDATVFDPSDDLKFKNDTPSYILIQTKIDLDKPSLVFDLYGLSDGRVSEIYNHQVFGITPPPPDLYQDDPTLPVGVVKQIDFAAWGAKASFQYKVTRNGQVITESTFKSDYRPWQAIYLKGTKE